MASPAPLTVYVEKTALPGAKASQYLTPIETNSRGEVTGITLSVPLFSERNSFLVVRLGGSVAAELVKAASEKPEAQRAQFIREWIKQNQLAIYDQYVKSGGESRRFQYNVVPVTGLNLSEVTPRRAVASATPRKVDEMIAPPAAELKRRGMVMEEEKPPKPAEAKAPETQRPQPVIAPPVPVKAELPPLPKEIRSGNGSRAKPYIVEPSAGRETSGDGSRVVDVPMPFQIEGLGTVYFKVRFTISQLKSDAMGSTAANLSVACSAGISRYAAEQNKAADRGAVRDAMKGLMQQMANIQNSAAKADTDVAEYLGVTPR